MFNLLDGLRVIDLSTVVLGPYATQLLGDLGADVIKVEPPAGDVLRAVRPGRSDKMGSVFLGLNRNKRSATLDLKSKQGMADLTDLLNDADVLVHNMRMSAAERLGLDYETLSKRFPRLVYCAAPGFGGGGRYGDMPAYDDVIQAMSGLASINANKEGEPRFLPTLACDKISGLHLALAVLSGAVHQLRTGKGCFIEVPMFESMVSFLMTEQLSGHRFNPPIGDLGYQRLLSPHCRPHKTKDGFICVLPYNGRQWTSFLNFIGRGDLADTDWVQDAVKRSERVGELYKVIDELTPQRTSDEWLTALRQLDVPCAPVLHLSDLLDDDHLRDVGFFTKVSHPTEGALDAVRSPFSVRGVEARPDKQPPNLGEHNDAMGWGDGGWHDGDDR